MPSDAVFADPRQASSTSTTAVPLYLSPPFVKAALVKGSFKTIVAPPKYVDVNEWVAINSESDSGDGPLNF